MPARIWLDDVTPCSHLARDRDHSPMNGEWCRDWPRAWRPVALRVTWGGGPTCTRTFCERTSYLVPETHTYTSFGFHDCTENANLSCQPYRALWTSASPWRSWFSHSLEALSETQSPLAFPWGHPPRVGVGVWELHQNLRRCTDVVFCLFLCIFLNSVFHFF